jgi:hypothetical protein
VQQFRVLPIAAKMARPSKTLLERVLAGSFRADRYASLLDGELLPRVLDQNLTTAHFRSFSSPALENKKAR